MFSKKIKSSLKLSALAFFAFAGTTAFAQVNSSMEKQIDDVISKMTLQEKINVCHAQSKFSSAGVPRLGIPEIWMSDGPHGVREEIEWDSWNPASFPAFIALITGSINVRTDRSRDSTRWP